MVWEKVEKYTKFFFEEPSLIFSPLTSEKTCQITWPIIQILTHEKGTFVPNEGWKSKEKTCNLMRKRIEPVLTFYYNFE